jgi:cyanate permease
LGTLREVDTVIVPGILRRNFEKAVGTTAGAYRRTFKNAG